MTIDINIEDKDKNMNSEEFNIEVVKNIIDFLQMMDCKLYNTDEIGRETENIICSCIEDLELLFL